MPLQTTVIGSWPKPSYLPLPDWFSLAECKNGQSSMAGGYDPTERDSIVKTTGENQVDELLGKAINEVIGEQVKLGIDVITDGEIVRECYYMHIFRHIRGIDMDNLAKKIMRSGAYHTMAPAVRGKVELEGGPECWKEWKRSNDAAGGAAVVKYTLPGPMTIVDGLVNEFYDNVQDLYSDLVDVINKEVLALAEHGCTHIQIDEPVMMRYPENAMAFGIDNVSRCFSGLPDSVTRIVHFCCGYPDKLDSMDYLKAPKTNYQLLADKLDNAGFHQVSIEDKEARNDLSLLGMFKNTSVIMGVVAVARSRVETVEEIVERVGEALKHIPAQRLILAPDCGLGFLPLDILRKKLTNMVAAAKTFN